MPRLRPTTTLALLGILLVAGVVARPLPSAPRDIHLPPAALRRALPQRLVAAEVLPGLWGELWVRTLERRLFVSFDALNRARAHPIVMDGFPLDVAYLPGGRIVVLQWDGGRGTSLITITVTVDPAGNPVVLGRSSVPCTTLDDPTPRSLVVFDGAGRRPAAAVVQLHEDGGLLRVNLETGERDDLASPTRAVGALPALAALGAARDLSDAWDADAFGHLFALALRTTGDRTGGHLVLVDGDRDGDLDEVWRLGAGAWERHPALLERTADLAAEAAERAASGERLARALKRRGGS